MFSTAVPAKSCSVALAEPESSDWAGVPPVPSSLSSSSPPQAAKPNTATSAASASRVFQRDLVMGFPFVW